MLNIKCIASSNAIRERRVILHRDVWIEVVEAAVQRIHFAIVVVVDSSRRLIRACGSCCRPTRHAACWNASGDY